MKTMTMAKFRIEMYKWIKEAKPGEELNLTCNGEVVLKVSKAEASHEHK